MAISLLFAVMLLVGVGLMGIAALVALVLLLARSTSAGQGS